jgi:hypothetical protein
MSLTWVVDARQSAELALFIIEGAPETDASVVITTARHLRSLTLGKYGSFAAAIDDGVLGPAVEAIYLELMGEGVRYEHEKHYEPAINTQEIQSPQIRSATKRVPALIWPGCSCAQPRGPGRNDQQTGQASL